MKKLVELDVVLLRLLSWVTFAEAFNTNCETQFSPPGLPAPEPAESDRCPVLEWEQQFGFGWGWTYTYGLRPRSPRLINHARLRFT